MSRKRVSFMVLLSKNVIVELKLQFLHYCKQVACTKNRLKSRTQDLGACKLGGREGISAWTLVSQTWSHNKTKGLTKQNKYCSISSCSSVFLQLWLGWRLFSSPCICCYGEDSLEKEVICQKSILNNKRLSCLLEFGISFPQRETFLQPSLA